MPILSSFGTLRKSLSQSRQNYSALFNNASYCGFGVTGLSPGSSNFSVEFFINIAGAPPSGAEDVIVDFNYQSFSSGMRITVTDLRWIDVRISTSDGSLFLNSSYTALALDTWYYICVSRVSGNLNFFLNSTLTNQAAINRSVSFGGNRFGAGINSLTTNYLNARLASFRYNLGTGFSSVTVPTAPLVTTAQTKILTFQSATIINEFDGGSPTSNTGVTVSQTGPF